MGKSHGISTSGITIDGASIVTATGGVANETSCGIHSAAAVVIADTSTVNASGGESMTTDSSGLWADSVAISDSSNVNATGGKAQSGSHGIYGRNSVTISGKARVEASGSTDGTDTYGISCGNGSISIDGTLTATGNTQAISGTWKNAIAGTGWTNTAGTTGKAGIAVNTDQGQDLTGYKKVQFPALPTAKLKTVPKAKTLTYKGSAQVLVDLGSTSEGTLFYALGENTATAPETDAESTPDEQKKWKTSAVCARSKGTPRP